MSKKPTQHKNIEDIYPLSPMQQGMLFHKLLEPESPTYNELMYFKLRGPIEPQVFRNALRALVRRHSVLRTAFIYKKSEKLLQVVHKEVELPVLMDDWRDKTSEEQSIGFKILLDKDRKKGFNLSKAPLLRLHLLRLEDDLWQVLWSNHHLILDGWSNPILLKELFILYETGLKGLEAPLPPARPFKEYILWLQKQDKEKANVFWKDFLQEFSVPTPFNVDKLPNQRKSMDRYGKQQFRLNRTETARIKATARKENLTVNSMVQGAWALLLHHYSRENQIVFGATVSGRPAEITDIQNMVGLFINTLPLCVNIDPQKSTNTWLKEVQRMAVLLRDFEYSALADVQKQSAIDSGPLFESILVFENYPVEEEMGRQKTSLTLSDFGVYEQTNFPLTLLVAADEEIIIDASYQPTRFTEPVITDMLGHLRNLLLSMARNPDLPLGQHKILNQEQEESLLKISKGPQQNYDSTAFIPIQFERQVRATPTQTVLIFDDRKWSYDALNRAVNRLARELIHAGIKADRRVAVYMERSAEMVLALYAIIKAGAAYVPIDPTNPTDRIRFMLEDSKPALILTQKKFIQDIRQSGHKHLIVDVDNLPERSEDNPKLDIAPDQAAYMIYTSGSTGRPKGAILPHKAIRNRLQWMQNTYKLDATDRILQKTPYTFDVSLWEFFWPLMYGATLVMARPEGHKDTAYLVQTIHDQKITTLHFVPPMLQVFLEAPGVGTCDSLKRVICSGEALPVDLKERFYKKLHADFHNLYGPTEAAVDVTAYACTQTLQNKLLPIGKPIANTNIYVLDEQLRPVPVGVPGELFIGGIQLARGYHLRPDLTAEKFIPDPFSKIPGARMYRSGDLVRRLPGGDIDYLSRLDFQLKIRGFRIELGEIEANLTALSEIREALVTVYEPQPGNKQLTAYITPANSGTVIDADNIRAALSASLPDYMIPVHFITLESFPLTPNGKIDRKALPAPEGPAPDTESYVAPGTALEKEIQTIWQDILAVEPIGIHRNFFQLGGHSILATRLVTRFRQAFKVEIPLSAVFDSPTIARQALLVEMEQASGQRPDLPELVPVARSGLLPVSLPQQRLWFIDQFNPGTTAYNINLALMINGKLDIELLEKSIRAVIDRHEILRTSFVNKDGAPYLHIHSDFDFHLEYAENKDGIPEEETVRSESAAMAATVFNLEELPLLRMRVVGFNDTRFLLTGVIHHIISDGQSMQVFINEVLAFYRALSTKNEVDMAPLPFQYADYASWQRQWLSGDILEKHIRYWKEKIGPQPDVLELPTDFPRPAVQSFNGRQIDFELEESQTARLKIFTQQNGVTLFMALMTAYQILLHRYSRQTNILIGSPVTGRLLEESNNLIGFFVNTLVLKGSFEASTTVAQTLQNIRQNVLEAHAHQSLPFEQLVELLQPERDLAHPPLFQAAFILQNAQSLAMDTAGLQFEEVVPESVVAKVDLSLYAIENADNISLRLEYNSDLFRAETIERMGRHLMRVLTGMLENPARKIAQIPLMGRREQDQLLQQLSARAADKLKMNNVVAAFRARVVENHSQTALSTNGSEISYAELDRLSDKAAGRLLETGIKTEDILGICMDRGPLTVIAMLAILKAGAAYLPLDPAYPGERLRYMAQDAGASFILTNDSTLEHAQSVFPPDIQLITMESLLQEGKTDNTLTLPEIGPLQLAYVIYTSGSTGKPKGTLLAHRGLVNLAHEQRKAFKIDSTSRILQFASLSFDAATWEIFMALLNGAALHLIETETQADIGLLQERMVAEKISTITLPPSVLALFDTRPMPDLKTIITAGEKCPQPLVKRFQPGRQMVNAYGPTETTVCACYYETNASETLNPPIGFPLGGFDLHVLDSNLQLLPVGVPGELCIGGIGLARGYLNRPDLTNEKFIAHPYGPPGARLYRSGDLVKRRDDGAMEFLGRIDSQVKLRGFRIELGEIQNALQEIASVRDAFVMIREEAPGDQRLCAYLVSDEEIDTMHIKEQLSAQLPDYMVPAAFVFLKALPLTVNGKVDVKNLPLPETGRTNLQVEFVAPRDGQEETIAGIVKELLNIETVGIHDNFFDLGGHSLLATRFVSRLRETLNIEVPLRVLFEHPTIAGMSEAFSGSEVRQIDADEPELVALDRGAEDDDDDLLDAMDGLSDDELNALLNEDDNE